MRHRFDTQSPWYMYPAHWLCGFANSALLIGWLFVVTIALLPTPAIRLFKGARASNTYAGIIAATWMDLVMWLVNTYRMHIEFRGDRIEPWENAIVLSNHQTMADPPLLLAIGHRVGALPRYTYMVKNSIRYVPLLGQSIWMLGYIFVKRNWPDDRLRIEATFLRVIQESRSFWLMLFPEGTRLTERKLRKKQEEAREKGLYVPQYTLPPKEKGFIASIQGLRRQLDVVLDVTVVYPDGVPTLWQLLQGIVPHVIIHLRRHPEQALPSEADDLRRWLVRRFEEKDVFIASMVR